MATIAALKLLLVEMIAPMILENRLGGQHFATNVALELRTVRVLLHVHRVRVFRVQDLLAVLALVLGTHQLMERVHVALQAVLLREPQLTVLALVRLLARMAAHVELQRLALRKRFAANVALEWPFSGMDVQVLLQRSLLRKRLFAVRTGKLFLGAGR